MVLVVLHRQAGMAAFSQSRPEQNCLYYPLEHGFGAMTEKASCPVKTSPVFIKAATQSSWSWLILNLAEVSMEEAPKYNWDLHSSCSANEKLAGFHLLSLIPPTPTCLSQSDTHSWELTLPRLFCTQDTGDHDSMEWAEWGVNQHVFGLSPSPKEY